MPYTEVLNESSVYQVPFQGAGLAAGYAKFYLFLRDELAGKIADLKIINPDGTIFNSWTYTSSADSKTRYVGFSKKLPTISGKYKFEANYNSTKCTFPFEITSKTANIESLSESLNLVSIFPNPSTGDIQLSNPTGKNLNVKIYNLKGEKISDASSQNDSELKFNLPKGFYFVNIIDDLGKVHTTKITIE